jgi:hypothetical protein
MQVQQKILDQKMSEIVTQLREINKSLQKPESAPF